MDDKLTDLQKTSKKLVIDDTVLYLRYDLNALVALEDKYETLEKAFNFDENEGKLVTKLRYILHVGVKANHKEMTIDEVGALFTIENMSTFQEAIESAVDQGMPEADKGDKSPLVEKAEKEKKAIKAGQ